MTARRGCNCSWHNTGWPPLSKIKSFRHEPRLDLVLSWSKTQEFGAKQTSRLHLNTRGSSTNCPALQQHPCGLENQAHTMCSSFSHQPPYLISSTPSGGESGSEERVLCLGWVAIGHLNAYLQNPFLLKASLCLPLFLIHKWKEELRSISPKRGHLLTISAPHFPNAWLNTVSSGAALPQPNTGV